LYTLTSFINDKFTITTRQKFVLKMKTHKYNKIMQWTNLWCHPWICSNDRHFCCAC